MSRRQGAIAGPGGSSQAGGSENGDITRYIYVIADNCSNPAVLAGPIRALGGVVSARVVDCLGCVWVEVCEDYGLFINECLRALNIPAAVLDRWLRRVAHRHCVCCGWETYDLCVQEEVGKAKEAIERLQRAARLWLVPYANVSPDLAFQDSSNFNWLFPSPAELTRRTGNSAPRLTDDKYSPNRRKTAFQADDKNPLDKELREEGHE